jgi:aerobic carbon-monoxide dehydrogenase large subunit
MALTSAQLAWRVEDDRMLRGKGLFVHDVSLPNQVYASFVRSSHSHAVIKSINFDELKAMPGVIAVLGAAELGQLVMPRSNPSIPPLKAFEQLEFFCLPDKTCSYVGQPLAIIIASSAVLAAQAVDKAWVDVESLSPTADLEGKALYAVRYGQPFAEIANTLTVKISHRQKRLIAMSLEPRACAAQWRHASQSLKIWLPTQTPSRSRDDLATSLGLTKEQIHLIAPDVGGAFGAKASLSPEDYIIAAAAKLLKTSIVWKSSRSEEFLTGAHGRGSQLSAALCVQNDGQLVGLKARLKFPLGAWPAFSAAIPMRNAARILPGPYQVSLVDITSEAGLSNAAPVNIYRGAGRPEAALVMERLIELAAHKLGIDPIETRRKNLITASQMPYITPTGERLDAGNYALALERAVDLFNYDTEKRLQIERQRKGEIVGIGTALYIEPCGQGWESARLTLQTNGRVLIASGSSAQGQGHETSFAVIAAKALGCSSELIDVVHGDTHTCPPGVGALASRSMAIGGSAVLQAAQIAKAQLEAGQPLPISAESIYTAPHEAWSYGCVMVRLRIDRDTGAPSIERLVWIDDAGCVISPQLAKGQLLGGLAQGIGQALLERLHYDNDGQLTTGSLMDYAIPRADAMPDVEIENLHIATSANLLGAKGVGEAGCIAPPAAILNAAFNALRGVNPHADDVLDQLNLSLNFPLNSEQLWQAIRKISHIAQP